MQIVLAWNRRDDDKLVKFFDQERSPSKLLSWRTGGILISILNTSLLLFLEGDGGSYFPKDGVFLLDLIVKSVLLTSYFFVCMTNQHASTDKSTTHSDRRYSQPAGDQGAGAERTYFYAHSKLQQKARKNDARFQGHLPPQDQQA